MKTVHMRIRGFTLIELLVVIAIISLLSSVILASLNNARVNARNASRIQIAEQYRNALEFLRTDSGSYPASTVSTVCLGNYSSPCGNGSTITFPVATAINSALSPYLPSLPVMPPATPYSGLAYWTCPGFGSCARWNAPNDTYILEWVQEGYNAPCGFGFPEFLPDPNFTYTYCAYVHR